MNVLSSWSKPQRSQWNQKGSHFSTPAVFLVGVCQSSQDKAGHHDRKSEDFRLGCFCPHHSYISSQCWTDWVLLHLFWNPARGQRPKKEAVVGKGSHQREIGELKCCCWGSPQNMQKWTKFKKQREEKNLKAECIIGLGSTCELMLVLFAQVELAPMAIAAGRFANARPIHRTGWWIHRRVTQWIKSFRKSFDSRADRPRSLCCSTFIMIPNVEKSTETL